MIRFIAANNLNKKKIFPNLSRSKSRHSGSYGSLYVPPCNSNLKAESQKHAILVPAILVQLPWQLFNPVQSPASIIHQQHREIFASRYLNNIIYVFLIINMF
jgi:hypothetical protein